MEQSSQKNTNPHIKSWHHQVLINRFLDRQQCKKHQASEVFANISYQSQKSLDTILFEEQMQQHVKLAMHALEPKQRAALILHYYQKYTQEQVADILGMTVNSLQTMLDNIRKNLQSELAKTIIGTSKIHQKFNSKDLFL
jgi:RNA polymerase sigma factor (sigma-70 family)